ncbi:2-C-methyl-D-erythritol 4-phosphate cytidylyltransferase [Bienertia sinuspersici]
MASKMVKFVDYNESDPLGWHKFMRFRVDLKIDRPLRRWIRVSVKGGSKRIEVKYEKLMDLCYVKEFNRKGEVRYKKCR